MRLRLLALLLLVMLLTACRGRPFAATDSLTPAGVVVVATLTPVRRGVDLAPGVLLVEGEHGVIVPGRGGEWRVAKRGVRI